MLMQEPLDTFLALLGNIEEPLGIFYTDREPTEGRTPTSEKGHACIINYLRMARSKKHSVWFSAETVGCMGGWVYMGFTTAPLERIAHYVTTGLPEKEGELYMPNPASMYRIFKAMEFQPAPGKYCVAKPLSVFGNDEKPDLVIFHCRAEALTGLCQLAYFALDDHDAITMPFGAGCSNIFAWPLLYKRKGINKAVVGGVDPSCRPFMKVDELSFTVPLNILEKMIEVAPRSFLGKKTWRGVLKRIAKSKKVWGEDE